MFKKLDRELTSDDVGKKVKLRDGREMIIKELSEEKKTYPITLSNGYLYMINGSFDRHIDTTIYDIVEIFEEPKEAIPENKYITKTETYTLELMGTAYLMNEQQLRDLRIELNYILGE